MEQFDKAIHSAASFMWHLASLSIATVVVIICLIVVWGGIKGTKKS